MGAARWSISLIALIGTLAVLIAGAMVWLLLTDPVTVATQVSHGDVGPLMQALGAVLYNALKGLFQYL